MRTCNELGICQGRTPPCRGESCRPQHYFAPGVIDVGQARLQRMRMVRRVCLRVAAVMTGVFFVLVFCGVFK